MGKYDALTHYLENQPEEIWEAQFSDVERVLGFPLPRSAHEYPAWWANQDPGHSQTRGWRDAGWETSRIDLAAKKVRFRRSFLKKSAKASAATSQTGLDDLWRRAEVITGINDRDELTEMALRSLLQREAAKALIELGGSDPHPKAPPRRRLW